MQGFGGTDIRDMVCDGKRLGVRYTIWIIPPRTEASHTLHRPAGMERGDLLFPVYPLRAALLLRADSQ